MEKKIGNYSFIIGVIIALVLGLASKALPDTAITWLASFMIVLGLIVGFLNVTGKDTKDFLIAATILVIVNYVGQASSNLSNVLYIGPYLQGVFTHIMAFVIPATVVVALKDIWSLGQNQ